MSNRRRVRPAVLNARTARIAEVVVTAGMVAQWREDPASVPPEWQEFWEQHGPQSVALGPVDDRPASELDPDELAERLGMREATAVDALHGLAERRDEVEASIAAVVAMARMQGATWQVLGDVLGMSKTGAAQRYGPS